MPTSTRSKIRADRDALCLLTATPDEAALAIACSLPTAADLLHLALTCQRFSARRVRVAAASEPATEANGANAAPTAAWSIAEEAARLWLLSRGSQQRDWVPRREQESWLGLMHELQLLQRPLIFDRRAQGFGGKIIGTDASIVNSDGDEEWEEPDLSIALMFGVELFCCAASKQVMRAGRHFAEFKLCKSKSASPDVAFGLIRPWWPVETERSCPVWAYPEHCFYSTFHGKQFSGAAGTEWLGQSTAVVGDSIGLLLDFDQRSVSVFKNGKRLGVMDHQKLFGEWSWSVAMYDHGDRVQISSSSLVDMPPSPTEEELATAKRWSTEHATMANDDSEDDSSDSGSDEQDDDDDNEL